ncbi:MAG: tRNA uridine-5-carboxymethylaminomethyl(34) synthesis GTPase MnmE [Crocinitomicaceae bacterium]|nr:tRNA uridine-5-carboxymethylaminomethyl(34) synthesis GTPase MnmE [Crocinitomicaceae bacterium]
MNYFDQKNDTICALSTASGMGAIAVIRISGAAAFEITNRIFTKNIAEVPSHSAHFGRIKNAAGEIIDEVLLTVLKEGRSFTGENTVEIACHGSTYIQQQILQLLLTSGCRMAQPGEFTMRAFLNGKMDLSQAEAVADLISSESKKAHEIAMNQMRGGFSSELNDLREKLIHFASLVELELDFAEEDVEFADRTELKALVSEVLAYIQRLMKSFELGNAIKNGVPVAIVGAPNTGKSTLLNQLLGEERAIVSNIAGTTRDVIEETLNIEGIIFRLIDTAGIREGAEAIEAIGIEKSKQKIDQAQLVVLMSDYSENESHHEGHSTMSTDETVVWAKQLQQIYPTKKFIVLANKMDMRPSANTLEEDDNLKILAISAKKGLGIEEFKKWLVDQIQAGFDVSQETIVTNVRHVEALEKAAFSLQQAKDGLVTQVTGDFIAMDIRQAMFHLGSITGSISTDDLLGNIFAKFCIGK